MYYLVFYRFVIVAKFGSLLHYHWQVNSKVSELWWSPRCTFSVKPLLWQHIKSYFSDWLIYFLGDGDDE